MFKNRKKTEVCSLSEEDIRNKLYGSAVGTAIETDKKKAKKKEPFTKEFARAVKEEAPDRAKIHSELALLKAELEQAKRKLKRVKGLSAKKMRLIAVFSFIAFLLILISALVIKKIFFHRPARQSAAGRAESVSGLSGYTVQVAVSGKLSDAERMVSELRSKGYKPFMNKSFYSSGREKYTIYVGRFGGKASAENQMQRLKVREGIKDSFVTNIPK